MSSFLLFSSLLRAQQNIDLRGAHASAIGGAGVGAVSEIDGARLNPATLIVQDERSISLKSFQQGYGLSFADNGREVLFPAYLSYENSKIELNSSTDVNVTQMTFGSAWKGFQNHFLGFNLIQATETYSPNQIQEVQIKKYTTDVGTYWAVSEQLSLGFVAKNIRLSSQSDEEKNLIYKLEQNLTYILGFEYDVLDIIKVRYDYGHVFHNDKNRNSGQHKLGFETVAVDWLTLRFGYQINEFLDQNYVTSGIGFGGPKFGLHYSYQKEQKFNKESHHSIDLVIPF